MRRKIVLKKRDIKPDTKYNSKLVRVLINKFMLSGNLRTSQKLVYSAATTLEKELNAPFPEILERALGNIKPGLGLRSRKQGGGKQKVIIAVTPERDITLAFQILKDTVRLIKHPKRKANEPKNVKLISPKPTFQILSEELKGAYNGTGRSVKKKEEILKQAESNRISAN